MELLAAMFGLCLVAGLGFPVGAFYAWLLGQPFNDDTFQPFVLAGSATVIVAFCLSVWLHMRWHRHQKGQ